MNGRIDIPGFIQIGNIAFNYWNYSYSNNNPKPWSNDFSIGCKRVFWRFYSISKNYYK